MKKPILFIIISVSTIISYSQFSQQMVISGNQMLLVDPKLYDLDNDGDLDLLSGTGGIQSDLQFNENLEPGVFSIDQLLVPVLPNGISAIQIADLNYDGTNEIIVGIPNENSIYCYEVVTGGKLTNKTTISSVANGVEQIIVIDIDNDGLDDIFSINNTNNKWYKNLGGLNFAVGVNISTISYLYTDGMVVYDVDQDGDDDIVFFVTATDIVGWYENLGGGTFGSGTIIGSSIDYIQHIGMADLDNDLDKDIIVSATGTDDVVWIENLGSGTFGPVQIIDSLYSVKSTSYADINGDGFTDIIGIGGFQVEWYQNYGNGTFSTGMNISTQIVQGKYVGSGDMDQDGDIDVFSAEVSNRKVAWYQNDGNGNFGNQILIQFEFDDLTSAKPIDFDLDGDIDLVTNSGVLQKKLWYENYSPGKWSAAQEFTQSSTVFGSFEVVDVDQDGDYDYVVTQNDDIIGWYQNQGNLNMSAFIQITNQVNDVKDIELVDVDLDGDLDLISASFTDDKIAWYENMGGGVFGSQVIISSSCDGPQRLCISDLNQDGLPDVIVTSKNDDELSVFQNLGGGNWAPQLIISNSYDQPFAVAAGDIDNDGDPDIAYSSLPNGKVAWFENLGSFNFGTEQFVSAVSTDYVSKICIADINDDGFLDLVYMPYMNSGFLKYNLNDGIGNFSSSQSFGKIYGNGDEINLADFNNDGDLDVVKVVYDNKLALYDNFLYGQKQIKGRLFQDLNSNFELDSADVGIAFHNVISTPQSDFSFTQADGNYFVNFTDNFGNYLIEPANLPHWSIITDSLSYSILLDSNFANIDSLNFGFQPDSVVNDFNLNLVGGFPRCNTIINYWVGCENIGTTTPNVVLRLILDSTVTFENCVFVPDSIVGDSLFWSVDSIQLFNNFIFPVQVSMPDFTSMGSVLSSILDVLVLDDNDSIVQIFTTQLNQTLVCAYDPNDKIAEPVGIDSLGFIHPDTEFIEYTIRFQNTGNDTAINIVINDKLDPNLDWQSIDILAYSFPTQVSVNQDGLVSFLFESIMLPDSNVNEIASHGFVKYSIKISPTASPGTTIENFAGIYFDSNPPVITNTTTHTLFDCNDLVTTNVSFSELETCASDTLFVQLDDYSEFGDYFFTLNDLDTLNSFDGYWILDQIGNNTVKLNVSNEFCDLSTTDFFIEVLPLPSVQITPLALTDFCLVDTEVELIGNPAGGVFSGNGMSSSFFNPYNSGEGTHPVIYEYTDAFGCNGTDTISMNVHAPISVFINEPSDTLLCSFESPIILNALPTGGVFSGTGVVSNTFDPLLAGEGNFILVYEYIDSNGCTSYDSTDINVASCLSINELKQRELKYYPNPVTDHLTIEFESGDLKNLLLEIYDQTGTRVYFNLHSAHSMMSLNCEFLSDGIYYIRITNLESEDIYDTIQFVKNS